MKFITKIMTVFLYGWWFFLQSIGEVRPQGSEESYKYNKLGHVAHTLKVSSSQIKCRNFHVYRLTLKTLTAV